ncbi:MAG: endonuclease domain-containing protein [Pseudomonadota bacterium]
MREREWRSKPHARPLRRTMTKAEIALWSRLKSRQMNGYKFRRQHPIDDYIADFACIKAKLVIELDGNAHHSAEAAERDAAKTLTLNSLGWSILRFSNEETLYQTDNVLNEISRRLPPPSR